MNHSELQEKLFDGYDGRLLPGEQGELSDHLVSCQECRVLLENWKQTVGMVLHPLRITGDRSFTQQVMREIRVSQAAEKEARPRFFARWAFPALAMSVGSFAAVLLYVSQPPASSTDSLFLADAQATPAEWISTAAKDDQILGSVVERP